MMFFMGPSERVLVAYVQRRIEEWLRQAEGRTAADLAKAAGVTPTHISTIRSGQRGIGFKTMRGLAKAWETTLARLEEEAVAWARDNPHALPAETRTERPERYPNRALAAEFARRSGVDPRAIEIIESMSLKSSSDPTPVEWFRLMETTATQVKHGLPFGEPLTQAQIDSTQPPPAAWRKSGKKP